MVNSVGKMKLNSFGFYLDKIVLHYLLTIGFVCSSTLVTYAFNNPASTKEQLLEIQLPELPLVKNSSLYLYPPEEVNQLKLILSLSKKQVELYDRDKLVASFPVAVGKKGWETPTGNFEIIQMIKDPSWENPWTGKVIPPSPDNPIGERWIGFWTDGKNFIGFHGTPGEHLIGQAVSHGCVRMRNKDIKQLFELVSLGIPVQVVK